MSYEEKESGRTGGGGAPAGEELGMGSFGKDCDSARSMPQVPPFEPSQLDQYVRFDLIPLHSPNALDAKGRSIGKVPLKGWRIQQPLTIDEARAHMYGGGNVGVRLRDNELVVDVDPRNFDKGDDPLARLGKDLGIDWFGFPTVVTGSGGFHIYMTKPEGVSLRDSVEGYSGIEFKSLGRQVVAAGSSHPDTRRPYLWDPLSISLGAISPAPATLIEFAARPAAPANADPGGGRSPEDLEAMLRGLNVTDFGDEAKWRELMMACHHATGGDGREEFIAWSTADPTYSDHAAIIGRRWDSLHSDGSGPKFTERTLFKRLAEAGKSDLIPRISAQEDFGGDAQDLLPDTFIDRPKRKGPTDEWVFVIDAEQFVRRSDGKKWKREQWKAKYAGLVKGDVISAIWKGELPMRKFDALVYLPCQSEFPNGESGDTYNIWRESGVEARAGDITPFLNHIDYLFPDVTEREYVLDYLAMLVQRPDQKVNYALLVKGSQGTGKSWIGRLMTRIIGMRNVTLPSNTEVMSQWTVWTEGAQLGIIEELMAVGRRDMANRLKPIITEPFLRIEDKGCSLYSIPNMLNLMAFTNHNDAVPIERGDRRWLVVFSDAKPRDDAYYDALFQFLDGDGPAAVKDWLAHRSIELNAKGMAPRTSGKDEMRRNSMGDAELFLSELLEEKEAPFDFPLVRFEDVLGAVPSDIARQSKGLRNRVSKWLVEEIGAIKHSRYSKPDRPNCCLWSLADHDTWETKGPAGRMDAFVAHPQSI